MKPTGKARSWIGTLLPIAAALALVAPASQAADKPIKIGVVTFLSGAAAGTFGIPVRDAAQAVAEDLNAGKVPAPYGTKGFGGAPIELTFIDEAGGTTKQVTEYRNLVQQQGVDLVIGYVSSGDCLAIAPVAEELKKLTVMFDCGTPQIFEEGSYKYVFRTGATGTMDSVAAAMYLKDRGIQVKKYAGINQNYAWGHDSWNDFTASMKQLFPDATISTEQFPKLGAGQYGAEISALLSSDAQIVHSSLWGGDTDALILQAAPRGLFQKKQVLLTVGEPQLVKLGADPGRHHHRRARPVRRFRARHAPEPVVPQGLHRPLQDPADLPHLQDGARHPGREGSLREGAGRQRRQGAGPGPGHRGVRAPHLGRPRRRSQAEPGQGPPGGLRNGLWRGQARRWQGDPGRRRVLQGRPGDAAGRREEPGLDQLWLQALSAHAPQAARRA